MAAGYYDLKQYSDAIKYYELAIANDEENSKFVYYKLGWLYNDAKKYNEAIEVLKKSISYDAKDGECWVESGYAYYMNNNYTDAEYQFNEAIKLLPTSKLAYYYNGLCYIAQNKKADAVKMYDKLKPINEEQADKLLKKINGD